MNDRCFERAPPMCNLSSKEAIVYHRDGCNGGMNLYGQRTIRHSDCSAAHLLVDHIESYCSVPF